MLHLIPSLPAASFRELKTVTDLLAGVVDEFQIDIVDGDFVEAVSWPFTESDPRAELKNITQITKNFSVGIDCMIMHPEAYLDLFVELGVGRVIVHYGSTDAYNEIIEHARSHGYKIGIAFTNDISVDAIEPYLADIDFVQVMGIVEVGKQGQPFDERALETIATLRKQYPDLDIGVDGSVNESTILALKDAGANRFAPGSAIAKADDPKAAYHQLHALVFAD